MRDTKSRTQGGVRLRAAVPSVYALALCLWSLVAGPGWAQSIPAYEPVAETPARLPAPSAVSLADDPEDNSAGALLAQWKAPKDEEIPEGLELVGFQVLLAEDDENFEPGPTVAADVLSASAGVNWRHEYRAKVAALYAAPEAEWHAPGAEPAEDAQHPVEAISALSPEAGPVRPVGVWYDKGKTNVLVGVAVYCLIVVLCFGYAQRADMYIRPIAGLEAVEDAVGRATEMGKPMLFVSGLHGVGDISTIASMLVLGHLARRTAAYETPILVPCVDPLVMSAEREIVREAYVEAGRPQSYQPDNIFYVTDRQFGYVAAVNGIMLRERPAAIFYMGYFYAESLILAETGNMSGAIQIAGTDADTQIPFFITACDYTLMGEELYAASAYLSRHPAQLAQLKGQDIGKVVMSVLLLAGALAATVSAMASNPRVVTLMDAVVNLFLPG